MRKCLTTLPSTYESSARSIHTTRVGPSQGAPCKGGLGQGHHMRVYNDPAEQG